MLDCSPADRECEATTVGRKCCAFFLAFSRISPVVFRGCFCVSPIFVRVVLAELLRVRMRRCFSVWIGDCPPCFVKFFPSYPPFFLVFRG